MFEPTPPTLYNLNVAQCFMWTRAMMTRYDFPQASRVILSNVRTDSNLTEVNISLHYELGQIMFRYDFLEDMWM